MNSGLGNVIFFGFLVLIVFSAAAFGTVEPWSIAIFELTVTVLLLLWAIKSFVDKRIELKLPPTFWPLAAFFVFGVFQSSFASIDAESTRFTVRILFFLLAAHLIAANFLAVESRFTTLAKFFTAFGFLMAVFGLVQYFTSNGAIFWFHPADTGVWLSGPFVNHNHFAGYMELLIPFPIALVFTGAVKESRVIYGFCAVVMIVATILTVSRGGIIGMSIALVFIGVCAYNFNRSHLSGGRVYSGLMLAEHEPRRRLKLRQVASAGLIALSIVAGLLWLGLEPIINRLPESSVTAQENAETFETSRGWIWKTAFAIFRANPVTGTGMGTFETAMPMYSVGNKASYDGKMMVWDRAHNDYLQILSDTGLIGGAIAFWFLIAVLVVVFRNFRIKDRFHAGMALACAGAILSLLVHSVFDFNLQLPATSLLFLTVVSIACGLVSRPAAQETGLVRQQRDVTVI